MDSEHLFQIKAAAAVEIELKQDALDILLRLGNA